jgi:hypothetical protein
MLREKHTISARVGAERMIMRTSLLLLDLSSLIG